ncbi:HORMA domain containing protein [Loktanella sp. M215]|uniref:HORMA domain containing protein n=1 Tax=Loktanella sp. M215 TaxID=2675431 RepID=UPI001F2636BD|nr:HORMA domain containing protein [Loktanella sp. M215]MCF7701596.1 HORMA domain containing protein [Loktanella sp. M215]
MTAVITYSHTQSVTYVADNILKSLKDIIRLSGMDPTNFVNDTEVNMRGIKTWLDSEDLEKITLEIYNPSTNGLILRWDIEVSYSWTSGDGNFWTDTDQLRWAIRKAGVAPENARYDLLLRTKPGRRDVQGWYTTTARSTEGMVRQSLGSTIEHNGLGASASYWRQAS